MGVVTLAEQQAFVREQIADARRSAAAWRRRAEVSPRPSLMEDVARTQDDFRVKCEAVLASLDLLAAAGVV